MIILLHGPNTFESEQKLAQIRAQFQEKTGTAGQIKTITPENFNLQTLHQSLSSTSLFATKQLIIARHLLRDLKTPEATELTNLLTTAAIPEDTTLILQESDTIKKSHKLRKSLTAPDAPTKFAEFEHTTKQPYQLETWATDYVATHAADQHITIEPKAAKTLVALTAAHQQRTATELDKLIAYTPSNTQITEQHIADLVTAELNTNMFAFLDALGTKNADRALTLLHDQLDSGESPLAVLGMLIYQFRTLLLVASMQDDNIPGPQIAKQAKLHPFVVQKTAAQTKNFPTKIAQQIYLKLLDAELKIKTGKLDPELALDTMTIAITK